MGAQSFTEQAALITRAHNHIPKVIGGVVTDRQEIELYLRQPLTAVERGRIDLVLRGQPYITRLGRMQTSRHAESD